jgi:hypothetical protein
MVVRRMRIIGGGLIPSPFSHEVVPGRPSGVWVVGTELADDFSGGLASFV